MAKCPSSCPWIGEFSPETAETRSAFSTACMKTGALKKKVKTAGACRARNTSLAFFSAFSSPVLLTQDRPSLSWCSRKRETALIRTDQRGCLVLSSRCLEMRRDENQERLEPRRRQEAVKWAPRFLSAPIQLKQTQMVADIKWQSWSVIAQTAVSGFRCKQEKRIFSKSRRKVNSNILKIALWMLHELYKIKWCRKRHDSDI